MKPKLIPAALIAATIATPAMACTDWKAVAAFDAIIAANDTTAVKNEDAFLAGSSAASKWCAKTEKALVKSNHASRLFAPVPTAIG